MGKRVGDNALQLQGMTGDTPSGSQSIRVSKGKKWDCKPRNALFIVGAIMAIAGLSLVAYGAFSHIRDIDRRTSVLCGGMIAVTGFFFMGTVALSYSERRG